MFTLPKSKFESNDRIKPSRGQRWMIAYTIDDLSSTENFAEESLHYDITQLREKSKKVKFTRFLPRSPT
jgi:hypothetical protein